jgi:hypothetical protein
MTTQSDQALDALREVWGSQGQTLAEVDEVCGITSQKVCRNAVHMGFEGYADDAADVRSGWRDQLEREGKRTKGGSLADLIFGTDAKPEETH